MSLWRPGARHVVGRKAELFRPAGRQQHGDVPPPICGQAVQLPHHRPALGRRQPVHFRFRVGGGEEPAADVGRRRRGSCDDRDAVAGRQGRRLDAVQQRRTGSRRDTRTTITDRQQQAKSAPSFRQTAVRTLSAVAVHQSIVNKWAVDRWQRQRQLTGGRRCRLTRIQQSETPSAKWPGSIIAVLVVVAEGTAVHWLINGTNERPSPWLT